MKILTASLALGLVAVGVPAAAAAAPQINVSVNPGTLSFPGAGQQRLTVTNAGDVASTIDVGVGNYSITPEGRVQIDPRLEPARSAMRWLTVSPARLSLDPRESQVVTVTAKPPHIAAPGDHHALVLLTGVADGARGDVQVRARVGVGTLVRIPGQLRRYFQVHNLRVHRSGPLKVFRLGVTNKGNVNERLNRGQVSVTLYRNGRRVLKVTSRTRSLLPGTSGIISMPYTGSLTGTFRAVATVRPMSPTFAGVGIASSQIRIVRRATLTL
jgi:hypothetical protein